MATLFIDFETPVTEKNSLRTMGLYEYLEWVKSVGGILGVAWAVDDDPVSWCAGTPDRAWLDEVASFVTNPTHVVVAHNAAFDVRVLTQVLEVPWPERVRCSLELAYAAWPNQPGALKRVDSDERSPNAYALKSLAVTLGLGMEKLDIDLMHYSDDELAKYCMRDVELCRAVYRRAVARLSDLELRVSELANQARELWFEVDHTRVAASMAEFEAAINESASEAMRLLDPEAFGTDGGRVRSVKPHVVRQQLLMKLGVELPTISYKKLNPARLAAVPELAATLKAVAETNKSLTHRRRVAAFAGASRVYCELGYARAHTFRYSSPSVGKGLNLHNCPKRNKRLAKAFRTLFAFPDGYVAVRADLSNVEYRGACYLTGNPHARQLFEANILADPYAAFWQAATGQRITKADPARQVAKAAVLGLSYLMGLQTWVSELLKALADPSTGLTVDDFQRIADEQGWQLDRYARSVMTKLNAPEALVRVAKGTHEAFHAVHPEFRRFAEWLELAVMMCSRAIDGAAAIEQAYQHPHAPRRDLVDLVWEDTPDMPRSVRVRVGGWPQPTVTWRDVGVRLVEGFGHTAVLSSRQAGSKGYRALTKNILIENVVQAWARNALVRGKVALDRYGYRYILSVHDEIIVVVPKRVEAVRRARDDIIEVYGPGNALGYEWAAVINPAEVSCSRTLYEVEQGPAWWDNLTPEALEQLP